jgi:putative tricarboxylic transport membrane protein
MELLGFDISSLFTWSVLWAVLLGTFVGMLIGALPGLGAVLAIALMLPVTYSMEPLAAILMLLAVYQGAEYGGSISAIVLGIPGTPAALVTAFDGHALAKQGKPGTALAYSLVSSTIGGLVGGLILILLSVPLVKFALSISDPEYFLIGLIGLLAVSALSSEDVIKSYISAILGLMAGTIGMDLFTGAPRFTMGQIELMEGINLIALLVGMFAFSELFMMISNNLHSTYVTDKKGLKIRMNFKQFRGIFRPVSIGSLIGSIVGIIPGMGAGPAAWFAYSASKSTSKSPESYGKGNPEGIAAPETANNAVVGGSLVPLLSLGIPGSPGIAIVLGAFIIHGIQPGPQLFSTEPNLVYGVMYGFLLTSVMMLIMGFFVTSLFSKALTIPTYILVPTVLIFSIIGTFSSRNLFFDLWAALIIGVITFIAIKLKYSTASFILAFILSPIIEESLRRSLILSEGSYSVFVTRPYSLILVIFIVVIIGITITKRYRDKKGKTKLNLGD